MRVAAGEKKTKIAAALGISRESVFKYLNASSGWNKEILPDVLRRLQPSDEADAMRWVAKGYGIKVGMNGRGPWNSGAAHIKADVPYLEVSARLFQLFSLVVFMVSATSIRRDISRPLKFSSLINRNRFITSGWS